MACGAGLPVDVLAAACTLLYLSIRFADRLSVPELQSIMSADRERESRNTESFVRQNLDALAVKLGEMQAHLTRLDALGERVSSLAGVKPTEFRLTENP